MSSAANQLDEVEVILDRETEGSRQLDVWMDGACGLCLKSREWCELRDHDRRLTFNDFRSARKSDLPVSPQDLESSMWVRDGEGNLLEGFAAWRRIMAELPRWKWLARLTSLPPFTLIGPALYRLVADNRRHFSRSL